VAGVVDGEVQGAVGPEALEERGEGRKMIRAGKRLGNRPGKGWGRLGEDEARHDDVVARVADGKI
jgi:hypothetical protein